MLCKKVEKDFLDILEEELIPAMGCTEPIALAFASAKAREILGEVPEKIIAKCSGNMIKNVRCVTIPNSGGLTGIETAENGILIVSGKRLIDLLQDGLHRVPDLGRGLVHALCVEDYRVGSSLGVAFNPDITVSPCA